MADESGGVTLKIDADTARYIASIAKAADANKKLHEGVKEGHGAMEKLTEKAGEMGKELLGWSGPLTVAGIGMGLLEKATEAFREKVALAGEALREVRDINTVIIGAGLGSQTKEVREAIDQAAPSMTGQQKSQFLSAYLRSNATATPEDIGADAAAAEKMSYLGRDQGQAGSMLGDFRRLGVAHAGDTVEYLMQRAPELAERAAAAIGRAPGQADSIAQLAATAARGGKPERQLFEHAVNAFVERGGQGQVGDYINERTAGRAGAAALGFFRNEKNRAPAVAEGLLDRSADAALSDTELGQDILERQAMEAAKDNSYGDKGGKVRRGKLADAITTLQDSKHGVFNNLMRDLELWENEGEESETTIRHYKSEGEQLNILKSMLHEARKGNEPAPLRPRPDQHGEKAP